MEQIEAAPDPGAVAPAAQAEPPVIEHPFEFRGTTSEYFRIWIVNLALTILTLGVFSAWAKVRTQRWFYGNTWVAGAPFEFLAQPITILKGRAIALVFLVGYVLAGQFSPFAQPVLLLLLGLASPWLIVSGLRFRARYSAWRSLNFRFVGTLGDAVKYFLVMFMLVLPTLGLILPWIKYLQKRWIVEEHRYGGHRLEFSAQGSDFYAIYILGWLVGMGLAIGLMFGAGFALAWLGGWLSDVAGPDAVQAGILGSIAMVYLGMFIGWAFIAARVTNILFNQTRLGAHTFRSRIRTRDLVWLYLGNTFAILLSAGMLVPWAMVRMARYRAQRTTLLAGGDVEEFRAESRAGMGAGGAETADVFDVDLSL